MPAPVIDTNVILRHLLQDSPDLSRRATELIRKIELGEQRVRLPETVVFEAVFVLEKQQSRPRHLILSRLLPIIELPGVEFRGKPALRNAFDLYVRLSSLSFADAYHAQLALEGAGGQIVSYDRGFDKIPGIKRIEP